MATIIDGKALAAKVIDGVKEEVKTLSARPVLAAVLVGENPASVIYVRNKENDCAKCGMVSIKYALPEMTTEAELLALIERLNRDETIDGILIQMPLPEGIDEANVKEAVSPKKDVDAFHPSNVGHIMTEDCDFLPCTPAGVMEMLREYGISVDGKVCVVVGRSNIVGKPMGMLLLQENGIVIYCHSHTENLGFFTRMADILVVSAGKRGLITKDMVKPGAAVIDVAMNRDTELDRWFGDVCFDEVSEVAGYISPVPGGVGPMTRAMLMVNVLRAAKMHGK